MTAPEQHIVASILRLRREVRTLRRYVLALAIATLGIVGVLIAAAR